MKFMRFFKGSIAAIAALAAGSASAAIISVVWVGTWASTGAGNPGGVGGPDIVAGQKYVVRISYNDASATSSADVLTETFADSGQDMTTMLLNGGSNTLDIFVPMEGLDAGTPFIYTQDEGDHFPAFIPTPTLNFALGSDVSDSSNIVGVEYEGDFVGGAGNNIIEMFNTAADAVSPINSVSQVINLGTGIAARDVGGLPNVAADVVAADSAVTYDAATLMATTALVVQGNDLGAGRSDGETFLDGAWSVAGTLQANGYDIAVAIADSGLANTTDSTTWNVTVSEEMTLLGDTAEVIVDYANASPTVNLSAAANATGYDFGFSMADADLAVNALILAFEALSVVAVTVDGFASGFFANLIATGVQSATQAELFAAFGAGNHTLSVTIEDLAMAMANANVSFFVDDIVIPPQVPEPGTAALVGLALFGLAMGRRRVTNRVTHTDA